MGQPERDLDKPKPAQAGEDALIGQLLPKATGRKQETGNGWERACLLGLMMPCLVPIAEKVESPPKPEDWKVCKEDFDRNLRKFSKEEQEFQRWQTRYFVNHNEQPSLQEGVNFLKVAELPNYPYNEAMVKNWVYEVMTDGKQEGRNYVDQKNHCRESAYHLANACQTLAAMGDPRAEKMVKPMEVAMQTTKDPLARKYLVVGLIHLLDAGVISKDQFVKIVGNALRNDLKNTPASKGKDDFDFKDREASLQLMAFCLNHYSTPEVVKLFKEIAADDKCTVPTLKEAVKDYLNPRPVGPLLMAWSPPQLSRP